MKYSQIAVRIRLERLAALKADGQKKSEERTTTELCYGCLHLKDWLISTGNESRYFEDEETTAVYIRDNDGNSKFDDWKETYDGHGLDYEEWMIWQKSKISPYYSEHFEKFKPVAQMVKKPCLSRKCIAGKER